MKWQRMERPARSPRYWERQNTCRSSKRHWQKKSKPTTNLPNSQKKSTPKPTKKVLRNKRTRPGWEERRKGTPLSQRACSDPFPTNEDELNRRRKYRCTTT